MLGAAFYRWPRLSQIWTIRQRSFHPAIPKLRYDMARIWTFRCYRSERGIDEIKAWYCEQPAKVRGKFLSRLKTLSQLPPHEWRPPYFRWLHGECEGLGEIRFEVMRTQYRPLGFQESKGLIFTLVMCAREVNDRFVPRNACQTGVLRKAAIERNEERSNVCWLVLE
jgi:hypothetical protein